MGLQEREKLQIYTPDKLTVKIAEEAIRTTEEVTMGINGRPWGAEIEEKPHLLTVTGTPKEIANIRDAIEDEITNNRRQRQTPLSPTIIYSN